MKHTPPKQLIEDLEEVDLESADSGWGLFQGKKREVHPYDWENFLACFDQLVKNSKELLTYVKEIQE